MQNKRFGEFIMMLLYIASVLLILTYFLDHSSHLSFELMFSFIYIESRRDPETLKSIWGALVVKSKI